MSFNFILDEVIPTGETGHMILGDTGVPGAGEKADTVTGERTKTRMGPGRGGAGEQ